MKQDVRIQIQNVKTEDDSNTELRVKIEKSFAQYIFFNGSGDCTLRVKNFRKVSTGRMPNRKSSDH